MHKHHSIFPNLICAMCLMVSFWGCETKSEPPKPQVVRKKIIAEVGPAKRSPKTKTVRSPNARASLRPKSDVSKTPTAMVAAKDKSSPVAAKPKDSAVKPQSAEFKPIADISKSPAVSQAPQQIAEKSAVPQTKSDTPSAPKEIDAKPSDTDAEPKKEAANDETIVASAKPTEASTTDKAPPLYNPLGKIDPFEPLFKDTPAVTEVQRKVKKRTPRTPLEKIAISQLKLVGIVLAPSGNKALVEEASGKGYIIKKGTYIGLNSGKVVDIQKDNVIIEEEVEDVLGKVTTRKKEIRLPKPPGE